MKCIIKHSNGKYVSGRTKGGMLLYSDKVKAQVFRFDSALKIVLGTIFLTIEKTKPNKIRGLNTR